MPKRPRGYVASEIAVLRRTLRKLDHSLRRMGSMLAAGLSRATSLQKRIARRRPRLSPKARAALKLQGRYMGYVRQLKPQQKAQIRKTRETRGIRAAITRARRLARRRKAA